jgi:hypothetical protein
MAEPITPGGAEGAPQQGGLMTPQDAEHLIVGNGGAGLCSENRARSARSRSTVTGITARFGEACAAVRSGDDAASVREYLVRDGRAGEEPLVPGSPPSAVI